MENAIESFSEEQIYKFGKQRVWPVSKFFEEMNKFLKFLIFISIFVKGAVTYGRPKKGKGYLPKKECP